MRRIAVRGVIVKDGKLFAQRLHKEGNVNDYWCTPGGGLDDYESLEEGLCREMIEETGVEPVIGKLLAIQQYKDDEKEYLEFFYHITNADDYEAIDISSTSHGEIEVAECMFVDPETENVLPEFIKDMNVADIANSGSVQMFNYL